MREAEDELGAGFGGGGEGGGAADLDVVAPLELQPQASDLDPFVGEAEVLL